MHSSRAGILCGVVVAIALRSSVAGAQDVDAARRAAAERQYNLATKIQKDRLWDPESGLRTDAYCVRVAIRSFRILPSKFAAWRVASCAMAAQQYVTAWLAFQAFTRQFPGGVGEFENDLLDHEDVRHVRDDAARIDSLVGAVRLPPAPPGTTVQWAGGDPTLVEPGTIPELPRELASYQGLVYSAVTEERRISIQESGEAREQAVRFRPLREGPQDVSLGPAPAPHVAEAPPPPPVSEPAPEPAAPAVTVEESVAVPAATVVTTAPTGSSPLRTTGWVVGTTGLLATAGGIVLWVLADGIKTDLDGACPTRVGCDPTRRSDYDQGRTFTTFGNVLVPVGAGVAALGVVLLLVSGGSGDDTTVQVEASERGAAVAMRGVF